MKNIHEITTMTQKQVVLNELLENGYITNLWCLQRGIWRLSHWIYELRKENYKIETHFENVRGHKNCKYTMEATVEQKSFLDKLKQFVQKFIRFNI